MADSSEIARDSTVASLTSRVSPTPAPGFAVEIGYKIMGIGAIDIVNQTFFCNFKLFARWCDPALVGADELDVERHWPDCQNASAFEPDLVITNEFEVKFSEVSVKLKDPQRGQVKLTLSLRATLKFFACFANFPFDFVDLRISVRSHKHSAADMVLTHWKDRGRSSTSVDDATACAAVDARSCSCDQWEVIGHRSEVFTTTSQASSTGKRYSEFSIVVMIQRQSQWYMINVFLVMFALLLMSLACLMIPVNDVGQRLEILLGIYFCVTAVRFSVAEQLPKLPYNTFADWYIMVIHIFIFLVVIETAVVGRIFGRRLCDDYEEGCLVTQQIDDGFLVGHAVVNLLFHAVLAYKVCGCWRATKLWKRTALEDLNVRTALQDRVYSITETNGRVVRQDSKVSKLEQNHSFRLPEQGQGGAVARSQTT